jgi:hypothetical protein
MNSWIAPAPVSAIVELCPGCGCLKRATPGRCALGHGQAATVEVTRHLCQFVGHSFIQGRCMNCRAPWLKARN